MKKPQKWSALVCVIALLFVVSGCSDDDDNAMALPIDPATAAVAMVAAVDEVVLPTFAVLSFLGNLLPATQPGGGGIGGTCEGGGTYSISELDITFNQCQEGDILLDGTVTITDPQVGAIAWNMTLNGDPVVGSGQLTPGTCGPLLSYGSLSVQGEDVETTVSGALEQCKGIFPEGTISLHAVGQAYDVTIELFFDGSALFTGTVFDENAGVLSAVCNGDLLVPSAVCVDPSET